MGVRASCAYKNCSNTAFDSGYCGRHGGFNYVSQTRSYSTPVCQICKKYYAMSGYALCSDCNSRQQALKTQGYADFYGPGR
jgi:hypothetical protein